MSTRIALLAIALTVTTATACIPIQVTQECKERINACLRNCESSAPPPRTDFGGNPHGDNQSPCERDCNNVCD